MTVEIAERIYEKAWDMLVDFAKEQGINKSELEHYFQPQNGLSFMERAAESLQNSGHMINSIRFKENRKIIKEVLYSFDENKIIENYQDWEALYQKFRDHGIQDKTKTENGGNWRKYSRGLFNIAEFFADNKSELEKTCQKGNMDSALSLLKKLKKSVYGMGIPLACDFLKECGCTVLVKPDIHIIKIYNEIFGAQIPNEPSDKQAQQVIVDMAEMANQIGVTPYKLDKIFWLICTGEFYLHPKKYGREFLLKEIQNITKYCMV